MDEFAFVPLGRHDLPLLAGWLARPHVARWWREPSDLAAVAQRYGPVVEGIDRTEAFIAYFRGHPIGYVQRYLIDEDPEWSGTIHAALRDAGGIGMDYLIGEPDLVGQGVGRRMISGFTKTCWERYPSEHRITVALQQDNVASWKALEACGFRRAWSGNLKSSDPGDRGPSYIYIADRPGD